MRYLLLIILLLTTIKISAQGDWISTSFAMHGTTADSGSLIWADAGYDLSSNTLSQTLFSEAFNGAISGPASGSVVALDPSGHTNLQATGGGEMWFRMRKFQNLPSLALLLTAGFAERFYLSSRNGFAQLLLRGNAEFEGQSLPFDNTYMSYFSFQHLGGGVEVSSASTVMGLTACFGKVSRAAGLTIQDGSLYTAPGGTELNGYLDMEVMMSAKNQNKLSAWYGTALFTNAYISHHTANHKTLFTIQIREVGVAIFEGINRWSFQDSFRFRGADVSDYRNLTDSLFSSSSIDSPESLLGIEKSNKGGSINLPGKIRAIVSHRFGDRIVLTAMAEQVFFRSGFRLTASAAYMPLDILSIQPTVRLGGFSKFDYGLNIGWKPKAYISLYLQTMLFKAVLTPEKPTGQAAMLGAMIRLNR
ncbi:MAG: hypothetical protein Kow0075_13850 [Salibacteraceae bacterium]